MALANLPAEAPFAHILPDFAGSQKRFVSSPRVDPFLREIRVHQAQGNLLEHKPER